jgi:hypothetical protein
MSCYLHSTFRSNSNNNDILYWVGSMRLRSKTLIELEPGAKRSFAKRVEIGLDRVILLTIDF